MQPDLELERDLVDFITDSMKAVGFLDDFSAFAGRPEAMTTTVAQFFEEWCMRRNEGLIKPPFAPGIFVGYLYCGILLAKEVWFDLVPDVPLDATTGTDWGLAPGCCTDSKRPTPTLKHVVRRLRNALGHGNVRIDVPADLRSVDDLKARARFHFFDENQRDATDTFRAALSVNELAALVRQFQSKIHFHVLSKIPGGLEAARAAQSASNVSVAQTRLARPDPHACPSCGGSGWRLDSPARVGDSGAGAGAIAWVLPGTCTNCGFSRPFRLVPM